ncbi:hemolysin family protein [Devosia psychrophila]|jgi:CBS domain containing-hemolysin-like protein|uniref:Polyamine export protein n=1 Tax=Devosia psychrophila TaxID=728005 RepID=A0A0F5PTG3_9HYPH|nr:hemolysin family protein [Devosia psychrophila]KKC31074.1 hemolysin C [Devosia psychrophila]SFD14534.1 Hemolysin, contains CBS domains [Devosia psychrophila]
MDLLVGVTLLLLLIGISIIIALSEIAFAAARELRIRSLAEAGNKKALRFMALRAKSGEVITALQIATNAVSILAGTLGEDTLGPVFGGGLLALGVEPGAARIAGSVLAFVLVTSAFVLFADLTPKRIAMLVPEDVALGVVWFPELAVKLLKPLVWLFSRMSDGLIGLLQLEPKVPGDAVTAEDFRMILAGGAASGVLMKNEHRLIENVLALELRSVTSVMTIRDDIVYLDISDPHDVQEDKVRRRPFSHYPICDGGIDSVIGCVRAEDVLATAIDRPAEVDFAKAKRDVLSVPDTLNVWEVLAEFQAQSTGFAVVVSEYALVVGVVTFKDLMGALMQGLANPFEEQAILKRDDNSWLIDGMAPFVDVMRALGIRHLEAEAAYETIGGFIVHRMRRAARRGDKVEAAGFVFEVVDADKMRLNQLLVSKSGKASKQAV